MAAIQFSSPESAILAGRIISKVDEAAIKSVADCHVYKRRWLMLVIYMLCAVAVESHWLHYATTAQTVTKYYGVTDNIVDLTSTVYSITFVLFIAPAIWLIRRYGLKKMLICGDGLIIAGSGLKLLSELTFQQVLVSISCCDVQTYEISGLRPEHFYVGFAGQILAGTAQVFIINMPSYLAGSWFPKDEVSTACALGVLGTEVGYALSFLLPPYLIVLGEKTSVEGQEMKTGLLYVYIYLAILPVVILPLLIFVFKGIPPKPPNFSRIARHQGASKGKSSVLQLMKNTNYVLNVVSYSLNISVFDTIQTMMNQIILDEVFAGTVGTVIVAFGICGCFLFGWLLDKTHKFKLIASATYMLSIAGLIMFWLGRIFNLHASVYILSAIILGLFLGSYVIISIEFSSELTYPLSETLSTSVLLASGQLVEVFFITFSALLFKNFGIFWLVGTTTVFLMIGLVPTLLIRNVHLKRQEASLGPFLLPNRTESVGEGKQQNEPTKEDEKEPKKDPEAKRK